MDSIVKTCENCKYDDEDVEGTHCRHCIHNAVEKFEPKASVMLEQKIRNKAIDEFVKKVVEQLEECQANYTQRRANNEYEEGLYDGCEHAIELLKAGGKNG